jgi:hypothetical protein
MKSYIDTKTKLSMGLDPFLPFASVSAKNSKSFQVDFEKEFASMILSASGWRKVFVSSGDEEDASESIGEVNAALAVYIAGIIAISRIFDCGVYKKTASSISIRSQYRKYRALSLTKGTMLRFFSCA